MIHIETFLSTISSLLSSTPVVFIVMLQAISIKTYLLVNLIKTNNKASKLLIYFLIFLLLGSLITDFDWIFVLSQKLFLNGSENKFIVFWRRLSWGSLTIQYQALALFLEGLITDNFRFKLRHKIYIFLSSLPSLFFVSMGLFNSNILHTAEKPILEFLVEKITCFYVYFFLMGTALVYCFITFRKKTLPRLLIKQVTILLSTLIIPFWLFDLLQMSPFIFSYTLEWLNNHYLYVSCSNIFLTIALLYSSRKMLGLRFLNFNPHVQSKVDLDFMEKFKVILEQLSHVTNMQELNHITQNFFKEAFTIPLNRTYLYLRNAGIDYKTYQDQRSTIYSDAETFLATHDKSLCTYLRNNKILVYDELAFSNFYESCPHRQAALNFLDTIQADLFLPIYQKESMIGYVIVDRAARNNTFYNSTEYDEMLIFASYLGNIINLMRHKNIDVLMQQEKALQDELYQKHQEINQYKESIRSFFRSNKQKDIGIIFYKNRRFTFGNQAAKEFLGFNPNIHDGHQITRSLKYIAQEVETYKIPQTVFTKDQNGNKLVLAAVPSIEKTNVIVSIYYPEISDLIKKQIDILKDPSEWDYLLYLETTQPGKLINQLIPGSGQILLNFKIELLKAALHKKATLITMAPSDTLAMAQVLHTISLREKLHTITLSDPVTTHDLAAKLFGMNPIFGQKTNEKPLLETLDQTGTLFIQNIHFLPLDVQDYLAEFIRYGFYHIYKSERKMTSNVRILCSSDQDLGALVTQKKFSKKLLDELKTTNIQMPKLDQLPTEEWNELAHGLGEQVIKNQTFKKLLTLNEKDKAKILSKQPLSLHDLKEHIQEQLKQKSTNQITHEKHIDAAIETSEPELAQAARLGKHALKDKKMMSTLWSKFKNQNKIASFLGVNRSSVSRRCKLFNLK